MMLDHHHHKDFWGFWQYKLGYFSCSDDLNLDYPYVLVNMIVFILLRSVTNLQMIYWKLQTLNSLQEIEQKM